MGAQKVATVYIDGFNLYHGLVFKGWNQYKWLDLCAFSAHIIPSGYKLGRVRYFTSRIKKDVAKHNRQHRYLSALKAHNGSDIEIRYGNYQIFDSHCKHCGNSPVFCRDCGREFSKPNEKKTDVNLATFMLTDCFEKLTDCIVLISGDSDYEAPLNEIRRLFPSVYRVVAYPPKRRNPALEPLCDVAFDIPEDCFRDSLLPNPVKTKNGRLAKPTDWP